MIFLFPLLGLMLNFHVMIQIRTIRKCRATRDQLLPRKARLETSYAFSRTFNSRNMEFYWYPLWCQTLFDLVADVPNLIVAPQFPVWIVKHNDQLEGADDGDDPEELEERAAQAEEDVAAGIQVPGNDDEEEGDHEPDSEAGDISFASTVPVKNAESVLVDFAIVCLTAVPQPEEKSRYGGWRINSASACLLVEVKRFVSRSLKDDELDAEIRAHIQEARIDLVIQSGHLFIQDKTKDSIMAIAAAGPYWSGTTIHRSDVGRTMDLVSSNDPSYRPPGEQLIDRRPKWNKILRLDGASSTVASEARLRTVYKKMREMGNSRTDAK
ncbi:uncharacterized protein BJ212DRAFT_834986 [Suillus subaureus]|uniref:Uncharacterized protein n=1 Tax=Suillus subaureus TaxID=48587 RepID=A0A9P7EJL1_9AGAM|nr:uncharacterized protein BJ212DRAFT_834986 [Suillus subaureus]KAG1822887.1 hypothetical protein BJ212DRAFT_834986 [Suillus subaureus]